MNQFCHFSNKYNCPSSPTRATSLYGNSNSFYQHYKTNKIDLSIPITDTSLSEQEHIIVKQEKTQSLFNQNTPPKLVDQNQEVGTSTNIIIKSQCTTKTGTMENESNDNAMNARYHSISCMEDCEDISSEELRWEHYQENRNGPHGNHPSIGWCGTPSPQATTPSVFVNSSTSSDQQNKMEESDLSTLLANTSFFEQKKNPVQQQQAPSLVSQSTSNLFGSSQGFGTMVSSEPTGTTIKFQCVTTTIPIELLSCCQKITNRHHSITCMKEYEDKSFEELRWEDYQANRKGPQGYQPATGLFGTGMNQPFGAGTIPPSSNLFGQTDNNSLIGSRAPSGFGQSSTSRTSQTRRSNGLYENQRLSR